MKRILMIATGGTIASKAGADGLVPAVNSAELIGYVPEIQNICEADTVQIFNIDSTNMTPEHWIALARLIKEKYDDYDGFVICHGHHGIYGCRTFLSYPRLA